MLHLRSLKKWKILKFYGKLRNWKLAVSSLQGSKALSLLHMALCHSMALPGWLLVVLLLACYPSVSIYLHLVGIPAFHAWRMLYVRLIRTRSGAPT